MAKPVTHKNFRPSIIANGLQEPFLEDFFGFIRIGGGRRPILKASVPCQRCTLTTIDPETGTIRTDGEPLKTLYRLKRQVGDTKISKLVGKSAILGAHFGCFEGTGSVIQVGQPIYAALL
ncbi:Mitochondrial amidoxime-reducing component 1 [Orchesella cincta]|uniref:Mitochondrial amidoxime-reducing component 1 n=1 Tax=Orchesella cincta TaxID=48709 RepID=A0A1D2MBK7_ORCCI|nr:Mitochondrial amidoxime-reducing component 1 [Orchesella cincta]